jgi:hypothetical protein
MHNILQAYFDFFEKKFLAFVDHHTTFFSIIQFLIFFYLLFGLAYMATSFLMRKSSSFSLASNSLSSENYSYLQPSTNFRWTLHSRR